MIRYVIDSYAWIEYFVGSDKGLLVKKIIESSENEVFSPIITVAEVISVCKRENRDFEEAYSNIIVLSKVYGVSVELAKEVGLLHAEIRKKIKDFGLADTFVLLTARKLGAKVVTGDPHFKGFKEVVLL